MTFLRKTWRWFFMGPLFIIGLFGFMAIIIVMNMNHFTGRYFTDSEIQELKESFPSFLAERLQREKKNSRLLKVEILSVKDMRNGRVNIGYAMLFDDLVEGKWIPSNVEASATLQSDHQIWKVVQVNPTKEIINFDD